MPTQAPSAWIQTGETLYYASGQAPLHAPYSPVTQLIQGLYALNPRQARGLLRHRIHVNFEPSVMCRGMVKVAAKRMSVTTEALPLTRTGKNVEISWPLPPSPLPASSPMELWSTASFASPRTDQDFMKLARSLSDPRLRARQGLPRGRPIAALLVSAEGELLGWGLNIDHENRTLHAEVSLLQSHYARTGKALPPGSRIYTTLKPCRMCAAMIWSCAEDIRTIQTFYGENDPGPHGQNTALSFGTPARKEAARDASELHARIESELKP